MKAVARTIFEQYRLIRRNLFRSKNKDIFTSYPRILFVFNHKMLFTGSVFMRCYQLARILSEFLCGRREIGVIDNYEAKQVKNKILILSKSFLQNCTINEILEFKNKNCFVFCDFIDEPIIPTLAEICDGFIASSRLQEIYLRYTFPDKPTYYIFHHVDFRIHSNFNEYDQFRIGYFGEKKNTIISQPIANLVDFNYINTKQISPSWIDKLRFYNAHYAIRNDISSGRIVFKPFLKGFTAAKCASNILVSRDDREAVLHLGDDYPYIIPNKEEISIVGGIQYMMYTYKTSVWNEALQRMSAIKHSTTHEALFLQFKIFLDDWHHAK